MRRGNNNLVRKKTRTFEWDLPCNTNSRAPNSTSQTTFKRGPSAQNSTPVGVFYDSSVPLKTEIFFQHDRKGEMWFQASSKQIDWLPTCLEEKAQDRATPPHKTLKSILWCTCSQTLLFMSNQKKTILYLFALIRRVSQIHAEFCHICRIFPLPPFGSQQFLSIDRFHFCRSSYLYSIIHQGLASIHRQYDDVEVFPMGYSNDWHTKAMWDQVSPSSACKILVGKGRQPCTTEYQILENDNDASSIDENCNESHASFLPIHSTPSTPKTTERFLFTTGSGNSQTDLFARWSIFLIPHTCVPRLFMNTLLCTNLAYDAEEMVDANSYIILQRRPAIPIEAFVSPLTFAPTSLRFLLYNMLWHFILHEMAHACCCFLHACICFHGNLLHTCIRVGDVCLTFFHCYTLNTGMHVFVLSQLIRFFLVWHREESSRKKMSCRHSWQEFLNDLMKE